MLCCSRPLHEPIVPSSHMYFEIKPRIDYTNVPIYKHRSWIVKLSKKSQASEMPTTFLQVRLDLQRIQPTRSLILTSAPIYPNFFTQWMLKTRHGVVCNYRRLIGHVAFIIDSRQMFLHGQAPMPILPKLQKEKNRVCLKANPNFSDS